MSNKTNEANRNYTPLKNDYQSQKTSDEVARSPQKSLENIENTRLITNTPPPKYIREKWKFIKFKRTVQKQGYTSARLMAKSLGVGKDTILAWTNLPVIQEALKQDLHNYTSKISKSKDWKAQAYLLDKIIEDKKEEAIINLTNLIQVNTIENKKNKIGDSTL